MGDASAEQQADEACLDDFNIHGLVGEGQAAATSEPCGSCPRTPWLPADGVVCGVSLGE